MRCKSSGPRLPILFCLASCLYGQQWSGIISPSRATDWSSVGIPGGIPSGTWTQCGSTVAAYGTNGSPAPPSTINNAIASCGTNQYVLLGGGDFYLNSGIDFATKSNVVLRGQGANQTRLHFSNVGGCDGWAAAICLEGSNTYANGSACGGCFEADWTGGFSQGSTQITLSSVTGITTNRTPIVLDQCETGLSGGTGTDACTGTATDNGNMFICDTTSVCVSETANTGIYRTNRAQEEVVIATAISGSGPYTVTISPAIRNPNWASKQGPRAWWGNTVIANSGVENLLVDQSTVGARSITMLMAYKCWIKGVASTTANFYHFMNLLSSHNVVRDSYMYWSYNSATQSYGIGGMVSADLLFENNIAQGVTDAIAFDASCAGCVAGYNFVINPYYQPSMNFMFPAVAFHSAGESMILVEGNIGPQVDSDDIHGTHDMNTFFRNYLTGYEPNNGTQTTTNTEPIHLGAFSRYMNIVGNVLGTPGYHSYYQCLTPGASVPSCTVSAGGGIQFKVPYDVGWSGNTHGQMEGGSNPADCGGPGQCVNDTLAGPTSMKWGNYDTVTGAVRWCGDSSDTGWSTICGGVSEVPAGDAYYPNSVPILGDASAGQRALPASFYYSSRPAWVPAAMNWPIIGPDVTSGSVYICTSGSYQNSLVLTGSECAGGTYAAVMAGHAQPNPAMQCYFNTMGGRPDGTGSILTFNANTCYNGQSAGPAPPTQLIVIPR